MQLSVLAPRLAGLILCAGALAAGPAAASAGNHRRPSRPAPTARRCVPRGRRAVATGAVVMWRVSTRGRATLYTCVPASGAVRRVPPSDSSAQGFLAAGPFVAFVNTNPNATSFSVFDALSGRTAVNADLGCGNPAPSCQPSPSAGFQLAPSGWVAYSDGGAPGSVTATNGQDNTLDIDDGPNLSVAGQRPGPRPGRFGQPVNVGAGATLTWSPNHDGVRYAVPLGPSLQVLDRNTLQRGKVSPLAPLPAPCSLFSAADAQAMLGPVTAATPTGSCTYTTAGAPAATVAVALSPSLSPAQVMAAKQAAYDGETAGPENPLISLGPPDYGQHYWTATWMTRTAGVEQYEEVQFLGNLELTIDVATNAQTLGAARTWPPATAATHASDLAFERLLGVPVTLLSGG